MKFRSSTCSLLMALAVVTTAAAASDAPPAKNASIPFADLGGINDWRADGDRALYIQGRNRKWYHAELMGFCPDLGFTEHIGFVIEPNGEFDRFSAIVVRGHSCALKSLSESAPPPKKAAKKQSESPADKPRK